VAALVASAISMSRLNTSKADHVQHNQVRDVNTTSLGTSTTVTVTTAQAGNTMDMTLFAVCRALDAIVGQLWHKRKQRKLVAGTWSRADSFIGSYTDSLVFATSCSAIMWAWFYHPDRLPVAYNRWISKAAQVDERLIETLRRCRKREFYYGKDTGQAPLLQGMCKDYNWPLAWGDPNQTIPIKCEMVHMGTGLSCEKHAVIRFLRAFKFGMATYLPLNLLVRIRSKKSGTFIKAFKSAARSSSFLAAFISIFYYSICLSRTRIGPKVLNPEKNIEKYMHIDGGFCVGCGCAACGWSVLVETPARRQELALFVAPRAGATFLPRTYDAKVRLHDSAP
jgi:hypothetical protein